MATAVIPARARTTRRGQSILSTYLGGAYLAFEIDRTTLEVRAADEVVGAIVEIVGERHDELLLRLGAKQRVWCKRAEVVVSGAAFDRSRRALGVGEVAT